LTVLMFGGQLAADAGVETLAAATAARASPKKTSFLRMTILHEQERFPLQSAGQVQTENL
jgi:hypothetical protein